VSAPLPSLSSYSLFTGASRVRAGGSTIPRANQTRLAAHR
jgi:hypothetical protein